MVVFRSQMGKGVKIRMGNLGEVVSGQERCDKLGDQQNGQASDQAACEAKLLRFDALARTGIEEKVQVANQLAALAYGVTEESFQRRIRSERRLTEARQLGMYLANVCFGIGFEDISTVIARDRSTIRYGIEKGEDRRENPFFDTMLVALETFISAMLDGDIAAVLANGLKIDHDLVAYVPTEP